MSPPEKPTTPDEPPATEAVLVSEIIPATRERIFAAWMDSDQHSAFTGDRAEIDPTVGGLHSSFDGYASGTTMSLEPFRRIVQTWRSTDFPQASADSLLEITLEETVGGTLLTLLHSEIPTGQSDRCREGWLRLYLEPLKRYFVGRLSNGVHAADKKALAASRTPAAARGKRALKPLASAASKGLRRRKSTGRAKVAAKTAGPQKTTARPKLATRAKKAAAAKPAPKRAAAPRKRPKAAQRAQSKGAKRSQPAKAKATRARAATKSARKPARKSRK
jgi:uncharacterized protein YndB with AHSA1/START domain